MMTTIWRATRQGYPWERDPRRRRDPPTSTRRFHALGFPSTEQSRRTQAASGLLSGLFNGAASVGRYTDEMEAGLASADDAPHRREWRDD